MVRHSLGDQRDIICDYTFLGQVFMRSCDAIWATWPNFMISLGHISVLVVNAVHVIGSRKRARRLKPPTITPSECNFSHTFVS